MAAAECTADMEQTRCSESDRYIRILRNVRKCLRNPHVICTGAGVLNVGGCAGAAGARAACQPTALRLRATGQTLPLGAAPLQVRGCASQAKAQTRCIQEILPGDPVSISAAHPLAVVCRQLGDASDGGLAAAAGLTINVYSADVAQRRARKASTSRSC